MTQTMPTTRMEEQRAYLLKMKETCHVPALDDRPSFDDCSEAERRAVQTIEASIMAGATSNALEKTYQGYQKKILKRILGTTATPKIEIIRSDEDIVPKLEWGLLPKELATQTGQWFRDYEQFSRHWSKRAYQLHHTGVALWLASAVIGGRVAVHYSGLHYPIVYSAIVSPSSVWAKSTTVRIGESMLHRAGLGWRLRAKTGSPEKFLSNMAGNHLPNDWAKLKPEKQEFIRLSLAHPGQIAWHYPEFGAMLRNFADKHSRNAAFKQHLLVMDDSEDTLDDDTHKHGREIVERPFLALIGVMTPANMIDFTPVDSSCWDDGTYARFWFSCPPPGVEKTREDLLATRHPEGERIIPGELYLPLQSLHQRLGERECHIIEEDGEFVIERGDIPEPTILSFASGARNALEDYGDALFLLSQDLGLKQFTSSYIRFKDKCLRIAMIAAALEDSPVIELRHIAFGQHTAEEFRASLHHLAIHIKQGNADAGTERLKEEEEILRYVEKSDMWLTSRLMRKNKFKHVDPDQFEYRLAALVKAGELVSKREGKAEYFTIAGKEKEKRFSDKTEVQNEVSL